MMTTYKINLDKVVESAKQERSEYLSKLARNSVELISRVFISELRNSRQKALARLQAA